MRVGVKTKKQYVFIGLLSLFLMTIFLCSEFVSAVKYSSYDKCIKGSGGRGDIASVKWACKTWMSDHASPTCALWLGGSNSASLTITSEKTSGKIDVYFYRMCISGYNSAGRAWTNDDNNSIADKTNVKGANWGSPKSTKTTLDIGKFIHGVTPTIKNGRYEYARTVDIWRRNAAASSCNSYSGACSHLKERIILSIPAPTVTLTLTANAVAKDGTALKNSCSSSSATVNTGSSATLSVNNANCGVSGYVFAGWRDVASSGALTGGNTYTKTISANKTVYAVYERNIFAGRIEVSGAVSGSIPDSDYTTSSSGSPKYVSIPNCSPTSGCKIAFADYVKRTSGGGTTPYQVSRSSNYPTAVANNSNVASGNSGNPNGEKIATDPSTGQFTLYPGMVVCETLSFKVYSTDTNNTSISLCVAAEGKSQPDDPGDPTPNGPTGDTSFINMMVKNNDVTAYNKYQKIVYAKPFDKLSYLGTYNPVLQYTYNLIPQKSQINGGTIYPTGTGINTARFLGRDNGTVKSMFNYYKNSDINAGKGYRDWNNDVNVKTVGFQTNTSTDYSHDNGSNTKIYLPEKNNPNKPYENIVKLGEVGRSLDRIISTNANSNVSTTPDQVTFRLSGKANIGNVSTAKREKTASAIVPYNFSTSTKITMDTGNKKLYAGETVSVTYDYNIDVRKNTITTNPDDKRSYATGVTNPKWYLEFCMGKSECDRGIFSYKTTVKTKTDQDFSIHSESEMYSGRSGNNAIKLSNTINIPDVSAGTMVCFRSSVYPKDSGSDTNTNENYYDVNNDNNWKKSDKVCFTVAKKPSIQVWGGNIYTRGKVTTATSTKNNIAGYNNYSYKVEGNSNGVRAFGSFGELGLIASGKVTGLSSGASMGFASNNNGVLSPNPLAEVINTNPNTPANASNPGGSAKSSICDRSPLTFANYPCSDAVGQLGKTATTTNMDDDKNNVLGKFIKELEGSNTGSPVVLNDRSKAQSDNTYYYYSTEDLDVGNSASDTGITKSTIQVVHSKKTLFVRGNLTYNETYQKYSELPKLVLYGKNVVIDCNVTRIDALILADEKVVTCNNFSDINGNSDVNSGSLFDNAKKHINEGANSNQLVINGAVVAKTLVANRTYGAASGANSIVPAEIINFDPTLYMWGGLGNDEGSDGDLEVTLMRELAPRR